MLRGVMLLGCCALLNAAPLDDAGRAELFARIQEAERNRVTTGQFKGEWTYTRTPRARSEADIAQAVAAHRQQYADALRSGQTTNATLEQWAKANGLSSAAEAARSPNAAKFLDMEVEAAAKSYEKTLRDASAVRVQRAEVSYALRPDHSQRVDRRFVAGTVDGQADPAASGFSEALVLDARRFRNYSPEHNNLLVREGMASDHSIEYEVAGRPALWDAGRSVATSIFTANHIVSSEPVTEGGEAAIKVVFCDQLSGEAGNTHVVWYLPDKGYAVLRSEQYVNGNLLVTQSYGSFREVQPGVWYPLEQQYINYTAELKASIRARLAAGELTLASEELRNNQTIMASAISQRRLSAVEAGVEPPSQLFDLHVPGGTTVQDLTLADASGRPLTFSVGVDGSGVAVAVDEALAEKAMKLNAASAAAGASTSSSQGAASGTQAHGTDAPASRRWVSVAIAVCIGLSLLGVLQWRKASRAS